MKRLIFSILIMYIYACSPGANNIAGPSNTQKFEWSASRKLTWQDYQGTPSRSQHDHIAARSVCRFGITINAAHVDVTSEFISSQSNVRAGQQTPALLAHEQLHFDLCEVYARRLRKELASMTLTKDNAAALSRPVFLKYYQAYKERQLIYDEETSHGLNAPQQKLWNEQVEKALHDLADYAK